MSLKISINSIFLSIYLIIIMLPRHYYNGTWGILENGLLLIGIFLLIIKKYRPSKWNIVMTLYFIYFTVITFINQTDMADWHFILSNIKTIVFLFLVEYEVNRKPNQTISIIFYMLSIFIMLDFLSICFFPKGLYQTEIIWNEWSQSDRAEWFFGNKNNRIYWYTLWIFLGYIRTIIYKGKLNKFFLYAMMIISPITMILVKSSTALVCAIIADLAIILGLQKGKQRFSISAKGMLIGYLVFDVIIIVGAATFLGPIVSKLFGKDLTFSGRTLIWPQVILKIWQKPVAGWGYMSGEESGNLFGNLAFSSAHNQLLNTLWQGGVILLFIVMVLFLLTLNVYRKTTHKMETVAVLLVLVILVDMTFESILNVRATWLILLMLYNWGYLYSKYLIRMK